MLNPDPTRFLYNLLGRGEALGSLPQWCIQWQVWPFTDDVEAMRVEQIFPVAGDSNEGQQQAFNYHAIDKPVRSQEGKPIHPTHTAVFADFLTLCLLMTNHF